MYTSIEDKTVADLLWASRYLGTSSEALEKHGSPYWQTVRSQDMLSKCFCYHCSGGITGLMVALAASCTVQRESLNFHWLCQLTGAELEQHFDPKTVITEGLFPPALLTKSMLKACCFPFLAWHKVLACLPCWTSFESWQCGQYPLCWVLSLLTTEGEGSSWVLIIQQLSPQHLLLSGSGSIWSAGKLADTPSRASSPGTGVFCCWVAESIWYLPGWQKHGVLKTWSLRENMRFVWLRSNESATVWQCNTGNSYFLGERSVHKISGSVRNSVLL